MKIALFALTGFGNVVAEAVRPAVIVTRRERGPFPHYECENISRTAARMGTPVYFDQDGENVVYAEPVWDLILAATYHRILPPWLIARGRHAVNLHPSLLPRYRGSNPFYWVLKNGERESGVTAHRLRNRPDSGEIYRQAAIPIKDGETEGSLRQRLAGLAGRIAADVVRAIEDCTLTGTPQDESRASYFPRP